MISFCADKLFVIDVRSLWNTVGLQERLVHTINIPFRIGLDMIGLPAHSSLYCDLTVSSVTAGMVLEGEISGTALGECVRCLAEVKTEITASFSQLYVYDWKDDQDDDELYPLQDRILDIEQALITVVIDQLPLSPLCFSDCRGLCSQCGSDFNNAPKHFHDNIDSRFASLAQFFT